MFNRKSPVLLSALCYLPLAFSWTDKRYAHFYDSNDCSGKGGIGVNMKNDGCLRQQNRHSVSLGGELAEGGLFCMVRYKDGDCRCIEGGTLYYNWPKLRADYCESANVEGYTSFHFEKIADFSKGCPTTGCYGSIEDPVQRTRYHNDGTVGETYVSYN